MTREDKAIISELVGAEIDRTLKRLGGMTDNVTITSTRNWSIAGDLPQGDGEGVMMPIHIGMRGDLTKSEAKIAAKAWRDMTARYPKAVFAIALLGYDEDPREIWDVPEAARYVRCWARYAGLEDIEVADRWLGSTSALARLGAERASGYMFLLAACGVFGNEARQEVIKSCPPPPVWS